MDQAVVRNFLVLYDEMYGISPGMAEEFKTTMSAGQLAVRFKGDLCPVPRRRIASVIGTTNNRMGNNYGFLSPAIGTRRFICIHLDSIDFDYMGAVDIDRVWAEAIQLSRQADYNYRLTQADYDDLDEANQRYIVDTPASNLLQQVYMLPDGTDPDSERWMTTTEIINELRRMRVIKSDMSKYVTPKLVGAALRALRFERKMIYGNGERMYKYHVKTIIFDE